MTDQPTALEWLLGTPVPPDHDPAPQEVVDSIRALLTSTGVDVDDHVQLNAIAATIVVIGQCLEGLPESEKDYQAVVITLDLFDEATHRLALS